MLDDREGGLGLFLLGELVHKSENDSLDGAVVLHHLLMMAAALGGVFGLDE